MSWLPQSVIDLTSLSSWWSSEDEDKRDKPVPIDVRIASWFTQNHIFITLASVVASLPAIKPKVGHYRGVFRWMIFFAATDLFLRGEGTAQEQCDAFRDRVQALLDSKNEQNYDETKQLYGGEAWQKIATACKEMAVDNPFKILDRCGWIVKANYSDINSRVTLITEAKNAMGDWLEPEVKATWGRQTINAIKLTIPYYLAQFWN